MRHIATYSMFVLFACAYATLDRLPRAALQALRGGAEHVLWSEITVISREL
jgi:hypothetical protein